MKLLIILLFSLSAHASYYLPEADFAKCQTGESVVFYSQAKRCAKVASKCIELETVNCAIFDMVDEIVNGEPILSKDNVTSCDSKEECLALGASLCENPDNFVWKENLLIGFGEAYCTRITGYEQVKTGRKVLKENVSKKAAWLANLEAKRLEQEAKKQEEAEIQEEMRKMAKERIKARKK